MTRRSFIIICASLLVLISSLIPHGLTAQKLEVQERSADALTGTEFKNEVQNLSLEEREQAIFREVMKGNIPEFLRDLAPVSFSETIKDSTFQVTFYVIRDYLAVGSDSDYFLMPMTPVLAQKICNALGMTLPTRKMVDQVWSAASIKLSPSPIPASPEMTTIPVMWQHNQTVRAQREENLDQFPPGSLVAGHKKDVIISNRIYRNPSPERVVIYGWHYQNGDPIQPVYAGHDNRYADYSHGIRLGHDSVRVNGETKSLAEILKSSKYAPLFSNEGKITKPFYPVEE